MKKQFGLWPKLALLFLLAALILPKLHIGKKADKPDKSDKPDQVSAHSFQFDLDAPLPMAYSQVEEPVTVDVGDPSTDIPIPDATTNSFWQLIKMNWGLVAGALLGVVEVIVRLTPTDKDNSLFNFLKFILDKIIPNQRKEDGAHD